MNWDGRWVAHWAGKRAVHWVGTRVDWKAVQKAARWVDSMVAHLVDLMVENSVANLDGHWAGH